VPCRLRASRRHILSRRKNLISRWLKRRRRTDVRRRGLAGRRAAARRQAVATTSTGMLRTLAEGTGGHCDVTAESACLLACVRAHTSRPVPSSQQRRQIRYVLVADVKRKRHATLHECTSPISSCSAALTSCRLVNNTFNKLQSKSLESKISNIVNVCFQIQHKFDTT